MLPPPPRGRYARGVRAASLHEKPLLYEQVADHLQSLIDRGALRVGQRLPSVRRLASQQGVSMATAILAYQTLENRGACEVRPQSGHYVRAQVKQLPEPRPIRIPTAPARVGIAELCERVYRSLRDPSLVPLGAAVPAASLLPADRLNRMLAQIARESGGAGLAYEPPPGHAGLRRVIAKRSVDFGCALTPDDIVTTVGCMEAIMLSLRAVVKAGDQVAVESPTYYGLWQLLESLELRVVEIPVGASGMDIDQLERVLATRPIRACICTPNFTNPAGALMPDDAKRRLVRLLARYEIPLIEDDIYGDLHRGNVRPRPAKAFDQKGLVMLCASYSKTIAPGYRVGWVAPGRFQSRVEQLKFAHTLATPTLPQMAVAEFLESGGYDRHLRRLRAALATQTEALAQLIARHFPTGTRVSRPAGGYVLWVELPPGVAGQDVHATALARGISVIPGEIFSARQQFSGYLRISAGHPVTDATEHSVRTLGEIVRAAVPTERAS